MIIRDMDKVKTKKMKKAEAEKGRVGLDKHNSQLYGCTLIKNFH